MPLDTGFGMGKKIMIRDKNPGSATTIDYFRPWQTRYQVPGRTEPEERGPDGRVARAAEVLHARQLRTERLLQLITDVHQVRFPADKSYNSSQ
jgi:hypothetical protein